ncbi:hypothetical protein SNE35_12810 [Paucibacter sp. R3-3]|uniref:Uncharacterized protein n=1 Tax=Roseateles agri TaxID=3098619 RepID=A0ABU5DI55_9BURK|nr:hypothetical protein [Paucibacter sp. R3-3]MDY0745395.1 hypothetical protein [Paucibacter sp. R3-3]
MSTATLLPTRLKPTHDAATDLCRHLQQCHLARGRWFGAAMLAEEIHRLVAPRFATTVAVSAVVLLLACAWL